MDLPLGDRDARFQPVRLDLLEYDLTDVFRRYQQHTVAELIEKPKYQGMADRVHAEYPRYLAWSVGEFLYALKRMEDSFYRSWLNPHGDAAYCTFKLADGEWLALRGLYAYAVDGHLTYIGRCRDSFGQRVNAGYGTIAPKNCYRDGQSTNCHLNALVNKHHQSVRFYVYPMENEDEIVAAESQLIARFQPPWNVQLSVPGTITLIPRGFGNRQENEGQVSQGSKADRASAGRKDRKVSEIALRRATNGPYRQFFRWLQHYPENRVNLSFKEVQTISGASLPNSARKHPRYWKGGQEGGTIGNAILAAGWHVESLNLSGERIVLIRDRDTDDW